MPKLYFLFISLLISFTTLHAQVVVISSGGTFLWNYHTLGGAFTAINNGRHKGEIYILLVSSTVERTTARLNASGNYSAINIRPLTVCAVSGNIAGPLIDLNGAKHVTIDGRICNQDTVRSLTIRNAYTSLTEQSTTIQFFNGARYNTIRYCNIEGSGQAPTSANILFGETNVSYGNSNNVIDHNDIRPANGLSNLYAIQGIEISLHTPVTNDSNIISNNLIHDFKSTTEGVPSIGLYLSEKETSVTISGNSFYEQDTTYVFQGFMHVRAGGNIIIRDNFLGGSAPYAGGHPARYAGAYPIFSGIVTGNSNHNTTYLIEGNTITNIEMIPSSGYSGLFTGILSFYLSRTLIQKNKIGSITDTGAIRMTFLANDTFLDRSLQIIGISVGSAGTAQNETVTNNEIGGFTINGPMGAEGLLIGIRKAGSPDTTNIYYNTIKNLQSNTANGVIDGIQIFCSDSQYNNCHHNAIQQLYINSQRGSMYGMTFALTYGFHKFSVMNAITDNQISHLYNSAVIGEAKGILVHEDIGNSTQAEGVYQNNAIVNNDISDLHSGTEVAGIENTSPSYKYLHIDSNAVYGLYSPSPVKGISSTGPRDAPVTINRNTIYDLENTALTAASVTGIDAVHNGNINAFQLSKNRIYNLRTPSSKTGIASGLLINGYKGVGTYDIQNNMISLSAANVEVYGINLFQNMTAATLYFNSVAISGTATRNNNSAALRKRAIPAAMKSVNNIYYNIRRGGTGGHYALINDRNPPSNGWVLSDYNDLYSLSDIALWYLSRLSFTAFQDSSHMDLHSISVPVQFADINNGDLHLLTGNNALVAGSPLTPVTDDYDGDKRNAIPTIGADELEIAMVAASLRTTDNSTLLYPNPAYNYLTVNLSGYKEMVILSIYDVKGRSMKDQKVNNATNATIDIQNLTPGAYLLVIKSTTSTVSRWFVKN